MEIANSLPSIARVLLVCHAKPKDMRKESCGVMRDIFLTIAPDKKINVELASDDAGVFINQIKNADAIYLSGGNTFVLLNFLRKISGLEDIWQGKVVAGSSAGALALAKYFYENDDDSFGEGLGILPMKIFCHYSADRLGKIKELKAYKENLEIKAIPEEHFIIIEK